MNLNPGSNTQESVIQDLKRRLGSSATFIKLGPWYRRRSVVGVLRIFDFTLYALLSKREGNYVVGLHPIENQCFGKDFIIITKDILRQKL